MTAKLTPHQALDHLLDASPDVRGGVVLGVDGRRLAGRRSLAGPARELLAATDEPEIEVGVGRGAVFASRSPSGRRTIVVVTDRTALPALMLADLRMTLGRMSGT